MYEQWCTNRLLKLETRYRLRKGSHFYDSASNELIAKKPDRKIAHQEDLPLVIFVQMSVVSIDETAAVPEEMGRLVKQNISYIGNRRSDVCLAV